jgi:hypothetical protein
MMHDQILLITKMMVEIFQVKKNVYKCFLVLLINMKKI